MRNLLPESIFVTTVVIAVVQLIKFVKNREWDSVITIVSAATVGALAGFFKVDSLSITTGILAGLAATGIVTLAQKFGGK